MTVTALMASGVLDSSLQFHIQNAKACGVTKEEMAEILTHAAFYVGWPKDVYKRQVTGDVIASNYNTKVMKKLLQIL